MNISHFMTADPVTIGKHNTIYEALERMEQAECHHLPVIGNDNHVIGILSANDCRRALSTPLLRRDNWEHQPLAREIEVRSVMTPAPIVIEATAPAQEGARLMLTHNIGCLPVMRGETMVGIVTTSDILIAFINHQEQLDRDAAWETNGQAAG